MAESVAIRLSSVGKHFEGGPSVLENISLEIPPGEFHAIVGPSGCGKSTLLRLVAGLILPSSGEVIVGYEQPDSRLETGFIFQEPRLLPWLTVRDNVSLPLRLRGQSPEGARQVAETLCGNLGLSDALEFYPRQLSGGMKMRAALAREMTLSPRILLLDEPLAALDAITRNRLHEELSSVQHKERWTGLLVTHSVNEAVFLADRVYVMSHRPGRISRTFDVPWFSPRTAVLRESLEYQRLVGEVMQALREVVDK